MIIDEQNNDYLSIKLMNARTYNTLLKRCKVKNNSNKFFQRGQQSEKVNTIMPPILNEYGLRFPLLVGYDI